MTKLTTTTTTATTMTSFMLLLTLWIIQSNNNNMMMMIESFTFTMKPIKKFNTLIRATSSTLSKTKKLHHDTLMMLRAKPKRYESNVDGVVYVNDQCINCGACNNFAPETFTRTGLHHIVYQQPQTYQQIEYARAALAACPVAAIRLDTSTKTKSSSSTTLNNQAQHYDKNHNNDNDNYNKEITVSSFSATSTIDVLKETSPVTDDEQLIKLMSLNPKQNMFQSPFPRPFMNDISNGIYWLGHHNERSFGATPYLFQSKHNGSIVWIMVDTPKFSSNAVNDILSVTNNTYPQYLLLTHVDDTADHLLWKDYFNLKRIFHSNDLGSNNWLNDLTLESVEILLLPSTSSKSSSELQKQQEINSNNSKNNTNENLTIQLASYTLDGQMINYYDWLMKNDSDVIIFHTPGHSDGSITLYQRPSNQYSHGGVLFTGDSYAYKSISYVDNDSTGGHMTGFPRYGDNRSQQANTLLELLKLSWMMIAPGHGHPRDYRQHQQQHHIGNNRNLNNDNNYNDDEIKKLQATEMETAINELNQYNSRRR